METPAFLLRDQKRADEPEAGELAKLKELVVDFKKKEAEVKAAEEVLSEKKAAFNKVAQEEIPQLLRQYGMSDIKIDGQKITVKEDISINIPEENELEFYAFLKQRGEEDIVKLQVDFKRMPKEKTEELFAFLNGYDYDYESKTGIHVSTLKSYFRNLLGIGEEPEIREEGIAEGKFLKMSAVEPFAKTYIYYNTKIKG